MAAINLGNFLRRNPRPSVVYADEQRIEVTGGGRQWPEMVKTIESLNPPPKSLKLMDGKGVLIRAINYADLLDKDDDDGSEAPANTSEMDPLVVFGQELAKAYDRGSVATQPLIDNAFKFVEHLSSRLAKAEAEIERLRGRNAQLLNKVNELALELSLPPEHGDQSEMGLLGAVAQGMLAGQMPGAGATPITQAKRPKENAK